MDKAKQYTTIDIPGLSEEQLNILMRRELKKLVMEYGRYQTGIKFTEEDITRLVKGSIDVHSHGGSEPYERFALEDDIVKDYTRHGMRAIVIKTCYTPSASRVALMQRVADEYAEKNDLTPVQVFGGITLNYPVGGLNPRAVKNCLGFPGFKYVWLPMHDADLQYRIAFNDHSGSGISLLENGKVVPPLREILKIVADNDLVLATGHYPYCESMPVLEEALKLGVRRIEVIHPTILHSKWTIDQMKEGARQGIKFSLTGLVLGCYIDIEGQDYIYRYVKEVGPEHFVFGSDYGQKHFLPHMEGIRYSVRTMLAFGLTEEDITTIMKKNTARLIGLES